MTLDQIEEAVCLKKRLTDLNAQIVNLWRIGMSEDTIRIFTVSQADAAKQAAKAAIRARIVEERFQVIIALQRLGVVFYEDF